MQAGSLALSPDGSRVAREGLFVGWRAGTLLPVASNALGGMLVAQVTMTLGGVAKGFAVVAGLVLTGISSAVLDGRLPELSLLVALVLVAASTFLHGYCAERRPSLVSRPREDHDD